MPLGKETRHKEKKGKLPVEGALVHEAAHASVSELALAGGPRRRCRRTELGQQIAVRGLVAGLTALPLARGLARALSRVHGSAWMPPTLGPATQHSLLRHGTGGRGDGRLNLLMTARLPA